MPDAALSDRVEAKAGVALPHGLLSLATVVPMSDIHEQMGVDWQPLTCAVASTTGWCPPDPGDVALEKVFGAVPAANAPPVTAYAGVDCSAVGWTFEEGIARVQAILATGEQKALEEWAWENIITVGATDVSGEPGDSSVVGRLAALESALAEVYGGAGVVHVPVILSAYMESHGLLIQQGSRLRTRTGHDVVIGAGYPALTGGDTVMAITGPVHVRQGEVAPVPGNNHEATTVRDGSGGLINDRRVLAERTSVILVECENFVASVERTCCGSLSS